MTVETSEAEPAHVGRTTIRPQAIRRLAEAAAADVAAVPARRVTAALADERGELIIRVSTPVELESRLAWSRTGLVDRAAELAEEVTSRLSELACRSVRRVDVRVTGAYRADEKRVL